MLTNKQKEIKIYKTEHNFSNDIIKVESLVGVSTDNFLRDYTERYVISSNPESSNWIILLETYSKMFIKYLEEEATYSAKTYQKYYTSIKYYLCALFLTKKIADTSSTIYNSISELRITDPIISRFFYEYLIVANLLPINETYIKEVLNKFPDIFTYSLILDTIGSNISKDNYDVAIESYNKSVCNIIKTLDKGKNMSLSQSIYGDTSLDNDYDDNVYNKMMKKLADNNDKNITIVTAKHRSNKSNTSETIPINNTTTEILNTMTTKSSPTSNTLASGEMVLGKATSRVQDTIDVTVNVHKESIQNAATIEAGNIALTFLTERLKNVLPPQAQLFLYLPGSEIMIATVATIGIHTFAPDNPKAMIAAKAMTTAAYGKLFAKINVSKLIEDVIDKIPTDMLSNILPSKD